MQIGVQLYTVRDQLAADFVGTLRKVCEIGYTMVELPWVCGQARDLKKTLDSIGLMAIGSHFPIDQLRDNLCKVIADARTLELRHVVCPWVPEEMRQDETGWMQVAEILNRAGAALRAHDIQLSYHNHSFEFVRLGGRYAMDLLFAETNARNLHSELDTYWIRHGHEDPVAYINRLAGRISILHLKDMADDADRSFAEVGSGILDWDAIFDAAAGAGVRYGVVEQDRCLGDPLVSIRNSLDYLRHRRTV